MTAAQHVKHADMRAVGELLNAKPRCLLDALEQHGIFERDAYGVRVPKLAYIKQGYFSLVLTRISKGTHHELRNRAVVTPIGVQFLREFIETLDNKSHILKP